MGYKYVPYSTLAPPPKKKGFCLVLLFTKYYLHESNDNVGKARAHSRYAYSSSQKRCEHLKYLNIIERIILKWASEYGSFRENVFTR
jgi:hypothetical protein